MSMNQMKTLLSCNIAPRASVLARMVMGLIGIAAASAWAQQSPSVKTGCNGQLSAEMTKIAAPYQKVAEAFKSTEKGWCALAVEVQKDDYISEPAALPMAWEFVSAAYVLHPAWNRKSWTAAQQNAMRELAQQISGADIPLRKGMKPAAIRRKYFDALYWHMRVVSATIHEIPRWNVYAVQSAVNEHAPEVGKTLGLSTAWGDLD
ncbi:UNVERIFIED_CONTAM: hypothetical protein C7454_1556 [Acidovorax defluvii]